MNTPDYSTLQRFLAKCSGANWDILQKCPNEVNKYALVGATLFTTAIMSSISSGYFVYYSFKSVFVSMIFAPFWGALIFSLDLYIVTSIHKKNQWPTSAEMVAIAPRILLAILLALVVSKPLELQLFKNEITVRMEKDDKDEMDRITNKNGDIDIMAQKADTAKTNKGIREKDKEIQASAENLERQRKQVDEKNNIWHDELLGKGNAYSSEHPGDGPLAKQREKEYNEAVNKYRQLFAKDSILRIQIAEDKNKLNSEFIHTHAVIDSMKKVNSTILANGRGPLKMVRALGEICHDDVNARNADIVLILIFLFIEIAPIVVKITSKPGNYELLCEEMDKNDLETKKKEFSLSRLKEENGLELQTREENFEFKHKASEQNQDVEYRESLTQTRKRKEYEKELEDLENQLP